MSTSLTRDFIDYSQYYSFWGKCPWAWYERYVNRVQKAYPPGAQRDDNLAVGSLVHAGLENWYKHGVPSIPALVVEELGPTPDALALCCALVNGFVRQYPVEGWTLERCEEPVRAPLTESVDLLAKIDSYFRVDAQMPLNSGLDGYDLSLAPGYWIQEFKTKAESVPRGKWVQTWTTNMQASFQILALQYKLRDEPLPVRGVLVSVLEKPTPYIPRRVCKACRESTEMRAWTEVAGEYLCPLCAHRQKLKPYEPRTVKTPNYFRIGVTRTEEELTLASRRIAQTSRLMEQLRSGAALPEELANTVNCVSTFWGPCEFFTNHTYNSPTVLDPAFERTRDYVGEAPLVGIDHGR
jgi:hypothetical protein